MRIFTVITLFCLTLSSKAEIQIAFSFEEVENYIETVLKDKNPQEQTIALFWDLDYTLTRFKSAIFSPAGLHPSGSSVYDKKCRELIATCNVDRPIDLATYVKVIEFQDRYKYSYAQYLINILRLNAGCELMHPSIPQKITEWTNLGCFQFSLTATPTSFMKVADTLISPPKLRIEELTGLKVVFNSLTTIVIPEKIENITCRFNDSLIDTQLKGIYLPMTAMQGITAGTAPFFTQGHIFSSTVPKEDCLEAFVNEIFKKKIDFAFFIDDGPNYAKNVHNKLNQMNIPSLCILYRDKLLFGDPSTMTLSPNEPSFTIESSPIPRPFFTKVSLTTEQIEMIDFQFDTLLNKGEWRPDAEAIQILQSEKSAKLLLPPPPPSPPVDEELFE